MDDPLFIWIAARTGVGLLLRISIKQHLGSCSACQVLTPLSPNTKLGGPLTDSTEKLFYVAFGLVPTLYLGEGGRSGKIFTSKLKTGVA